MKYLIILLALLVSGCMTVDKVRRNCDLFMAVCVTETETETETTTETTTETQYGDTTIIVYIPEKVVKDKIPVRIIDEKKKPVPVKKKYVNSALSVLTVDFARSTAQVVNSRLEHELTQTDTLLLVKLKDALKVVKTQEKQITVLKEKYVVTVKENTNFANFAIKIFWGLLIAVVLASGILIIKFKSKIIGLFR